MLIAACIKQVPDRQQVATDPQTHALRRSSAGRMLNPPDLHALEEALRLAHRLRQAGTEHARTLALSMGPAPALEVLREALALGIDEAHLLSDSAFAGGDTWATAVVLAAAVRRSGARLVLCGKLAVDGDTAQTPPELAAILGWPYAGYVANIREITPTHAIVERRLEQEREVMQIQLPAVLSVLREINVPRLSTLAGLLRAREAEVATLNRQALGLSEEETGHAGSRTRVCAIRPVIQTRAAKRLDASAANMATEILRIIQNAARPNG